MASPVFNSTAARFMTMRQEFPGAKVDQSGTFSDLFKRAINDASAMQDESKQLIEAFVRGEPVELHQVMAAAEEASISLQLLVEIRNKLTEAYRTVMQIQ